jgi:hypothetical protein
MSIVNCLIQILHSFENLLTNFKALEEPEMPYDDGVTMIFLNARGRQEGRPGELIQFLRYAEILSIVFRKFSFILNRLNHNTPVKLLARQGCLHGACP